MASVLFGEHDSNDTLGNVGIGCVLGVSRQRRIAIIDFEIDGMTIGFESSEVVLFVRIISMTEIIVHGDSLNDSSDGFGAEGGYAICHDGRSFAKVLSQSIVQRTNLFSLRVHLSLLLF